MTTRIVLPERTGTPTTGEQQLRLRAGSKAIVGTPVISGTTMLVTNKDGDLFAFRSN